MEYHLHAAIFQPVKKPRKRDNYRTFLHELKRKWIFLSNFLKEMSLNNELVFADIC